MNHSPIGRVEPKRGEGQSGLPARSIRCCPEEALPGRYRVRPSRNGRVTQLVTKGRLETARPPRSGARGARYSSLRELRNSATMRQTTFGVSPDLDDVIGLGWATYFGEASLTLAVGPPIGRPIRYRGHADRHATARSFEMLGRELVAAASQQSRQSQIVRRSVLGQSAAF